MKIEMQYQWRDPSRPLGKRTKASEYWWPDSPNRRREGLEPVMETAKAVMVRDQPCEWDYLYISSSTSDFRLAGGWKARLTYPKCCDEDPGTCPLAGDAVIYHVTQEGDVWTVTARHHDEARVIYQGPGPVYVSPNEQPA